MAELQAQDIKDSFKELCGQASFNMQCFDTPEYEHERRSAKRAQYCIDYARNELIAYLENYGTYFYMIYYVHLTPTEEEHDTFNDPDEVVKQAIIDRANNISIQDVYDSWSYADTHDSPFRYIGILHVISELQDAGCKAIDAFYASQPVCDCYVD